MFSTILKVIPKLDTTALAAMERSLGQRFKNVAKKFGSGITAIFKGGGAVGAIAGLIDKLLNPLQEINESLQRTLNAGDDLATNAAQFNTSAGRLFKLQALAQSTGLDADALFMLISKFQNAVAEAQQDPSKPSAVGNFVNEKDTVEAFYKFIQELQKLDKNQQILVQQQVFGEKQILKMSEFLNADFAKQEKLIGAGMGQNYDQAINKIASLSDMNDALAAKRNLQDMLNKSQALNEGIIRSRDAAEKLNLQRENARFASYQNLQTISDTTTKIFTLVENMLGTLGKFISFITPAINTMVSALSKLADSKLFRGIFGK